MWETSTLQACLIMIDAPALRDTGLLSSHQHHAVEKAVWCVLLHFKQLNLCICEGTFQHIGALPLDNSSGAKECAATKPRMRWRRKIVLSDLGTFWNLLVGEQDLKAWHRSERTDMRFGLSWLSEPDSTWLLFFGEWWACLERWKGFWNLKCPFLCVHIINVN
jgi:hypothetical protein